MPWNAADPPRRNKRQQSAWYNRLALLLLLLTPIVLVCYLLIFLIPTLPLNPFPPYAQAMATFAPTLTLQPTYTRTPTPTSTGTPTSTPRPSWTPTHTATPRPTLDLTTGTPRGSFLATRTFTPTPTPTVGPTKSPFNYTAEVLYQRAQLYGTNWSGIAGLIFGLDLKHQPGIGVKAWGDEPLRPTGQLLPSGTAPHYGPPAFESTLGDKLMSGTYNVGAARLTGEPLRSGRSEPGRSARQLGAYHLPTKSLTEKNVHDHEHFPSSALIFTLPFP
jgi:hypothetical protein